MKALPNGTSVTNFSVATSRVYKDKAGNKQEQTEFHRIVVYGKQAENCVTYLTKGQQVGIEGRIQTRSWEQDGHKRYMTEIIADEVKFGRKPNGAKATNKPAGQEERDVPLDNDLPSIDLNAEEINSKDLPF